MIRITSRESPEFRSGTETRERTSPCRSCGGKGEFVVEIKDKQSSGGIVLPMCRRCLRELAARSARASKLLASGEKVLLASGDMENTK